MGERITIPPAYRLLDIRHEDPLSAALYSHNVIRYLLVLAFPEEFPFSQVVNPQEFANANKETSREGAECRGDVIHRGFVDQLQVRSIINLKEGVSVGVVCFYTLHVEQIKPL